MAESNKPKIKLSELADIYDIEEEDKLENLEEVKNKSDYDITIEEEDKKLEEEFEHES